MTAMVEVIIPPTIGAAIGFITSELIPVSQSSGPRLPMTANTVIKTGRNRNCPIHYRRRDVLVL